MSKSRRGLEGRALLSPLVSVVVPVYNEQDVIERLYERIAASLAGTNCRWELMLVNDGSCDATPRVIDWLAGRDSRVRAIHFSRNFGHQAAVAAGLRHAGGDCIVLMDGDLQDSPEALPEFLRAWRDGFDIVYAVRVQRKEQWLKRAMFDGFYRLLAAISDTPIPLDAGNFGLIDARVARELVALGEHDPYFPGLRSWVGFRHIGVPVERQARYDDQPRVTWRGLFRLAKTAIFSFSTFPLTLFAVLGCSALGLFGFLGSFALVCKLFTSWAIPGWTSHILTGSFFGAINALGISMLGEYVIRIYNEVRARPLYVIERTSGSSRADDHKTQALSTHSETVGTCFALGEGPAESSTLTVGSLPAADGEMQLCELLLSEAEALAATAQQALAIYQVPQPVASPRSASPTASSRQRKKSLRRTSSRPGRKQSRAK